MTDNKYDIDRLIAYFEMAVKVMGWKNPEQDSYEFHAAKMLKQLREERDEARRYSCDLEARITMLEEDRRDTSNNFGTNPCSEIILPDYPLARDSKEIAKRKGWDCYKEETK